MNAKSTHLDREQRTVEALRHLTLELAELVDLRGRVAHARAVLARGGQGSDAAALAILDGELPHRPERCPDQGPHHHGEAQGGD